MTLPSRDWAFTNSLPVLLPPPTTRPPCFSFVELCFHSYARSFNTPMHHRQMNAAPTRHMDWDSLEPRKLRPGYLTDASWWSMCMTAITRFTGSSVPYSHLFRYDLHPWLALNCAPDTRVNVKSASHCRLPRSRHLAALRVSCGRIRYLASASPFPSFFGGRAFIRFFAWSIHVLPLAVSFSSILSPFASDSLRSFVILASRLPATSITFRCLRATAICGKRCQVSSQDPRNRYAVCVI